MVFLSVLWMGLLFDIMQQHLHIYGYNVTQAFMMDMISSGLMKKMPLEPEKIHVAKDQN